MGRDKATDPRREARLTLEQRRQRPIEVGSAAVWALLNIGDALHRIAKALEAPIPEDELAARRYRYGQDAA